MIWNEKKIVYLQCTGGVSLQSARAGDAGLRSYPTNLMRLTPPEGACGIFSCLFNYQQRFPLFVPDSPFV